MGGGSCPNPCLPSLSFLLLLLISQITLNSKFVFYFSLKQTFIDQLISGATSRPASADCGVKTKKSKPRQNKDHRGQLNHEGLNKKKCRHRKVVPGDFFGCSRCRYSPTGCLACNPDKTMKWLAKEQEQKGKRCGRSDRGNEGSLKQRPASNRSDLGGGAGG